MLFRSRYHHLSLSPASKPPARFHGPRKNSRWIPKRPLRVVFLLMAVLIACISAPYLIQLKLPPLYESFRYREDNLSHYDADAPYPNGRHAKYIFFANHQRGVGWGNVMQELLLNALLAYTIKRSFVFYNYEWGTRTRYSLYNGHLIPSTIPLSAIVSGPLVGGPMSPLNVPQAVSEKHFLEVCPNRTIIRSEELRGQLEGATALQILEAWAAKFGAMEDPCIEIPRGSWSIFDFLLFGSKNVLDIWPTLLKSPIITQFDWSPLIYSAFDSNRYLFELSPSINTTHGGASTSPLLRRIPGLLVIHIRRGDYATHCDGLARYSAGFNGFNQFDGLPDKFEVPQGGRSKNAPDNYAIYRKRCYPSISQIVFKVSEVNQKVPGLDRLYIMTNGRREWIDQLSRALRASGNWDAISSSRDLTLTWEQRFVAHALDMLVAQRAQSFIGNGWSTLTSNTVLLRMAENHGTNTAFFW
ncbi:hypothetical protein M378DRAFT_12930 [Amanita muscaria Koide BX008]|uniref:Uncharacterized protein n=1 Tax=Amanita muscaria (strain Koide BX008) TaxID=946122 RepID=A0A0C2WZP6_AMAMK|nr:hypothetical protein M378DRAFT_12930 [Amanita muscaria Koide BX008]